jgi:hypothetical protein
MSTKTFDPNQFTITLTGLGISHVVTGFAQDTFLSWAFDEALWNDVNDANFNTTRFKRNNFNSKFTLTLSQASPSNDALSTFMNLDRQIDSTGAFAIMAKDNNGTTLITSAFAYILEAPTADVGTDNNNRSWVIRLTETGVFIGGIN